MILIIKHISIEGPGAIGNFFKDTNWQIEIVDLDKGDRLPVGLSEIEAVMVLGSPMNVYEQQKYPFLKDEDVFLKKAIKEEIPMIVKRQAVVP